MTEFDVLEGKTVLVVDDMSMIRRVLARYLNGMGARVLEAEDAESALTVMHEQSIDAFLLDIYLPGMDGIELCRRLRNMERFQYTPVLFITSLEEEAVLKRAFAAGGDDLISKPITEVVLEARLGNHLKRMEYARQIAYTRRGLNLYVCPRTQQVAELQAQSGTPPPPEPREVCVLFSDVRGFTQYSQEIDSQLLFKVLSEHLGAQVKYVYRYGGYIDKFSGDGIMAVFDGPKMAVNSCLCALKIIEYAREQASCIEAPLYKLGIGIHKGQVVIGNIGSDRQLDYTVIGPTVNLAARLCGHADALSVVISEAVRLEVAQDRRFEVSAPRHLQVKGVKKAVCAYILSSGEKITHIPPIDDIDALPV